MIAVREKDKTDQMGVVSSEAKSRHHRIQVLVIDDHPVIFEATRKLFERVGVSRTLYANRLSQGFRLYRTAKPDLIFIDLFIGGGPLRGLSFIRRLRLVDQHTPIIVLSMHGDPLIASHALKIGANGYVVKDAEPEELIQAFKNVRDGAPYVSHDMASQIAFLASRQHAGNPLEGISEREAEILSQLAKGKSYRRIADNLLVSYKTVANTTSALKRKLGARSLPELMQIAMRYLPMTGAGPSRPPRIPRAGLGERERARPRGNRRR